MSVTAWLVILVPLLLFAWLLGQAMPTRRDRQLQRLRTRAREQALQVSLRQIEDPDPPAAERVTSGGRVREALLEVAAYSLPWRAPENLAQQQALCWRVLRMRNHVQEQYDEGLLPGWCLDRPKLLWQTEVLTELSMLLARAPAGTMTLEANLRHVTLCWRERGEISEVDAIAALLADLAGLQVRLARAAT